MAAKDSSAENNWPSVSVGSLDSCGRLLVGGSGHGAGLICRLRGGWTEESGVIAVPGRGWRQGNRGRG